MYSICVRTLKEMVFQSQSSPIRKSLFFCCLIYLLVICVLRAEPRAVCMLSTCSTTKQPPTCDYFVVNKGSIGCKEKDIRMKINLCRGLCYPQCILFLKSIFSRCPPLPHIHKSSWIWLFFCLTSPHMWLSLTVRLYYPRKLCMFLGWVNVEKLAHG